MIRLFSVANSKSVESHGNAVEPSIVLQLENGALIYSWQTSAIDVELLLCRLRTDLTKSDADDCWAGIWRCSAKQDTLPAVLSCNWTGDYCWTEDGPDTGEYLMAWSWEKDDTTVAIGTEDDVLLLKRSETGSLPYRWKAFFGRAFWDRTYQHDYKQVGLPVLLPEMQKGEECQIKFIVAWSTGPGYRNLWNILEVPASTVLGACACS